MRIPSLVTFVSFLAQFFFLILVKLNEIENREGKGGLELGIFGEVLKFIFK